MAEYKRFFLLSSDLITAGSVILRGAEHRHLSKVLRMRIGDNAVVCTSTEELFCTIVSITDKESLLKIVNRTALKNGYPVTLYLGLIKGDKMELALQKAVEVGVGVIVPFASKNTVVSLSVEKNERLRKIAQEACKQCGRGNVAIANCLTFSEMLDHAGTSEKLFLCNEHEKQPIYLSEQVALSNCKSLSVIVGSEGGFTLEEAAKAVGAGAISVSLGETVLRAETAAIVASAFCCAKYHSKTTAE